MASDVVVLLASVSGTVGVAVVALRGTSAQLRATTGGVLAETRGAAYTRYLEAQHEVAGMLWAVRPIPALAEDARARSKDPNVRKGVADEALAQHFEERWESEDKEKWDESGFAEMQASLLAGEEVAEAIVTFERYIKGLLVDRLILPVDGVPMPISEWHLEWESKRADMMDAMRAEKRRDLALPRPCWWHTWRSPR